MLHLTRKSLIIENYARRTQKGFKLRMRRRLLRMDGVQSLLSDFLEERIFREKETWGRKIKPGEI